jgi:hypothetical protein
MRKLVALIALIVAAVAFLIFTAPGQQILHIFGVPAPDCTRADILNTLGFHVPQCTCGNCSPPICRRLGRDCGP